jgi:hypothetical protein
MTTEYKVYEPANSGIATNSGTAEDELRRRAVKRLRAKAGFWTHLVVYLAVNAFLVTIWFFTGRASSGRSSRSLVGGSGWRRTPGMSSDASRSPRSASNAR